MLKVFRVSWPRGSSNVNEKATRERDRTVSGTLVTVWDKVVRRRHPSGVIANETGTQLTNT